MCIRDSTKGLAYRVKVTDAAGYIFSNTTTAYVADSDSAAPYFTPVAQVDGSLDNGAKQTRTVYADYDAYGNVLREDQSGDLSTTSDDRTVVRTFGNNTTCLLYTSDAADERSSVDLGGRRIIKKKKTATLR